MLTLFVVMLTAGPSQSTEAAGTGMSLLTACRDAEDGKPITVESAGCASYTMGSVDASRFYAALYDRELPFRVFCAPENVTPLQYVKIVVKFLRDHPEQLHRSQQLLTQDALHAAFPCVKTK